MEKASFTFDLHFQWFISVHTCKAHKNKKPKNKLLFDSQLKAKICHHLDVLKHE